MRYHHDGNLPSPVELQCGDTVSADIAETFHLRDRTVTVEGFRPCDHECPSCNGTGGSRWTVEIRDGIDAFAGYAEEFSYPVIVATPCDCLVAGVDA